MQSAKVDGESELDKVFKEAEQRVLSDRGKKKLTGKQVAEINPAVLRRLLGDSASARVLDFLSLYGSFDYSFTETARNSGVDWKTLHTVWPALERYEIVKMTRQIGRAKLYKINPDSPIARALKLLNLEIAFFDAKRTA